MTTRKLPFLSKVKFRRLLGVGVRGNSEFKLQITCSDCSRKPKEDKGNELLLHGIA